MGMVDPELISMAHDASACALCAANAAVGRERATARRDRRSEVLPWAGALTLGVLIAVFGVGGDRWLGLGAVAGVLVGAAIARYAVHRALAQVRAAHEQTVVDLKRDADDLAAMVMRQFEWAVNDVAALKREQDRAQVTADLLVVQGRARERHIRKLEHELIAEREHAAAMSAPRAEFDVAEGA